MSKEMKYVIINRTHPLLFTDATPHSDLYHLKPTSAGMCQIFWNTQTNKFEVNVYGKSVSLKLESNPNTDHILIERMLNHSF